jgi:lysozyme family protein
MAVLHGAGQAIKIAQRATWAVLGHFQAMEVIDDGLLGEHTLEIINYFCADKYFLESYQAALMAERAGLMRLIVAIKPEEKEFLNGWLNRCYKWQ